METGNKSPQRKPNEFLQVMARAYATIGFITLGLTILLMYLLKSYNFGLGTLLGAMLGTLLAQFGETPKTRGIFFIRFPPGFLYHDSSYHQVSQHLEKCEKRVWPAGMMTFVILLFATLFIYIFYPSLPSTENRLFHALLGVVFGVSCSASFCFAWDFGAKSRLTNA